MNRYQLPFHHITSTAPGFDTTADDTSVTFALEATALREWSGPGGRSIRLASVTAGDFYMAIGDSNAEASSSAGVLVLGGTVEIFGPIKPSNTHIAMFSSTTVNVNVVIGFGQ